MNKLMGSYQLLEYYSVNMGCVLYFVLNESFFFFTAVPTIIM